MAALERQLAGLREALELEQERAKACVREREAMVHLVGWIQFNLAGVEEEAATARENARQMMGTLSQALHALERLRENQRGRQEAEARIAILEADLAALHGASRMNDRIWTKPGAKRQPWNAIMRRWIAPSWLWR